MVARPARELPIEKYYYGLGKGHERPSFELLLWRYELLHDPAELGYEHIS